MKFYSPKYKQLDLGLLRSSLDELDKTNRWVALGDLLPWTELEKEYNSRLDNQKKGAGNKPARTILGAMIIKHKLNLSDAETIEIIRESPYMQYFCGLHEFTDKPIFDPSLFVTIRKRISEDELKYLHKDILILMDLLVKNKTYYECLFLYEKRTLTAILRMYHQQAEMYRSKTHTCADRILSIFQSPYLQIRFTLKGRTEIYLRILKSMMAKAIGERNEIESSFGTGKRIYRANNIRAKLPDTARCWTGMCYFVKNVMKFLRELCLVLTEIWSFLINLVTMRDYVCYPLSVARN